jgi:hypothetical protein
LVGVTTEAGSASLRLSKTWAIFRIKRRLEFETS